MRECIARDCTAIEVLDIYHQLHTFSKHVQTYGISLYKDTWLLQNLLSDMFSSNKKLRNTLKIMVENGVAAKIADLLPFDESRQNIALWQIINSFTDEYGIEKSRAVEAIHTLAYGIGINKNILKGLVAENPPIVGEILSFGNYSWRVLAIKDGKVLVLCENIVDKQEYHTELEILTWSGCSLRKYLNTEFYESFLPTERERITETRIITRNNPWFGTKGGDDTNDFIFLLSIEESIMFFGDSGQLKSKNPDDEYCIDDKYNIDRLVKASDGSTVWWWLRSPGLDAIRTASILGSGKISIRGDLVNGMHGGIRPSMWIKI